MKTTVHPFPQRTPGRKVDARPQGERPAGTVIAFPGLDRLDLSYRLRPVALVAIAGRQDSAPRPAF